MHSARRRTLCKAALAALAAAPALSRAQPNDAGATVMHVRDASIARLPPNAEAQKSSDSPAPRAARAGRWSARAPLPFPRSEMAWAAAWNGRMHVVGGFGNLRVDRAYHQSTMRRKTPGPRRPRCRAAPATSASPPATACSMRSAATSTRTACRTKTSMCSTSPRASGARPRRCTRARAAASAVALNGKIHVIAGASGREIRKSVDWHEVYDPAAGQMGDARAAARGARSRRRGGA